MAVLTDLPSSEHERLALVELFAASRADDANQRRHHLDQAAVHAAAAERARTREAVPKGALFTPGRSED